MKLNSEHLERCLLSLAKAYEMLNQESKETIEYEIFRNATIKGFELCLETAGKLLKKSLKPYFPSAKLVDKLTFKEVYRHAAKHSLISLEACERWLTYRDNRNTTAHDYDEDFVEETLKLIPSFIQDVSNLVKALDHEKT